VVAGLQYVDCGEKVKPLRFGEFNINPSALPSPRRIFANTLSSFEEVICSINGSSSPELPDIR